MLKSLTLPQKEWLAQHLVEDVESEHEANENEVKDKEWEEFCYSFIDPDYDPVKTQEQIDFIRNSRYFDQERHTRSVWELAD